MHPKRIWHPKCGAVLVLLILILTAPQIAHTWGWDQGFSLMSPVLKAKSGGDEGGGATVLLTESAPTHQDVDVLEGGLTFVNTGSENTHHLVVADTGMSSGESIIWCFEARRAIDPENGAGVGIATSSMDGATNVGRDATGHSIGSIVTDNTSVTNSSMWSGNSWRGSLGALHEWLGVCVDYSASNPTIYFLAHTGTSEPFGSPDVIGSRTEASISDPVFPAIGNKPTNFHPYLSGETYAFELNFGATSFYYDHCSLLQDEGVITLCSEVTKWGGE